MSPDTVSSDVSSVGCCSAHSLDPNASLAVRIQHRLIRSIEWYQQAFSWRPSPCRFTPTCSAYAIEALETFGAGRGSWLTLRRLVRCRPFGPSGFDPVPEKR